MVFEEMPREGFPEMAGKNHPVWGRRPSRGEREDYLQPAAGSDFLGRSKLMYSDDLNIFPRKGYLERGNPQWVSIFGGGGYRVWGKERENWKMCVEGVPIH